MNEFDIQTFKNKFASLSANENRNLYNDILLEALKHKKWEYKLGLYVKDFEKVDFLRNPDKPAISIIVISWRLHPDNLKNFQILEKQRHQNFELIFVDNGGKEGEFEILKPYVDTFVRLNKNTGAYLARNVGAVFAKAPVLLFLEDDGIPEHNFVEAHLSIHRKFDVIAVRGVYRPKTDTPINKIAKHYYMGDMPYPYPSNLEGNSSYRADSFYKIGGWDDEILFGYGGWDLAVRLIEVEPDRRKQIYSPEPVIYHDFATNAEHLSSKFEKHEVSLKRLKNKHPQWDAITNSWNKFAERYDALILKNNKQALPANTAWSLKLPVNKNKLVMTLLVRNEEDIIRYNIDYHLRKGVDFIIATDNGSTDATRDILREYEEKGFLHLIDEEIHNHNQEEWNNRMAKIARDQYAADIIFHCDADEFWYPRSGNLKNEIVNRPEDILLVDLINVIPMDKGGTERFPEDTRFAVVNPIEARDYLEETRGENIYYFKYPPKVIFKTLKKLLLVSQGNHGVTNKDSSITEGKSQDILIYHYPIRGKEHFFQKTILGGSAYDKNEIQSKNIGFHKRRWYASYNNGLLGEEYKKLILNDSEVNNLLRDGFIEEIDFEDLILGHKKSEIIWRYFNRRFEYEDMFQDFYWSWAGHKYFAYDLIRNVKPNLIVELGTHKGTSFFSFCQAVKDARYDAKLYAVDTWQGDKHVGYYDDNVFNEVNEIKEKYYGSLKINLLRKTFDEAIDEFEDNSIDLLHIDGLHTHGAVKHDFETWLPKVTFDGIILLHDVFISRDDFGVYKFWEELKRKYKTIEFHQSYGLGVLFKDSQHYQTFIDRGRDWQIRYSTIAEDKKHEGTKKSFDNFEKSLSDRDKQISSLTQSVAERDFALSSLISELGKIKSSLSWKLTMPLCFVNKLLRRYWTAIRKHLCRSRGGSNEK